ncbi:MAG TPA: histidine kinase [Streptosporangiaceae bacterium]|nr:histidine kinase [Streptosporangiaceae bacterium]
MAYVTLPSALDVAGSMVLVAATIGLCVLRRRGRERRGLATPAEEAAFATLHTIAQASPALRAGLNPGSARKAARHLRSLLGADAIAVTDGERLLAWEGAGQRHAESSLRHAAPVLRDGRPRVVPPEQVACPDPGCRIRVAVIAPLTIEGRVAGTLAAYGPGARAPRVRALGEVARWVSGQLELAELDASRARLVEAKMKALRAQISPHFVYNSLTTIASFVRTNPERARELLLDFADFARYSFRTSREFTTLAEELRSIDRYLLLERARFGERLQFTVEIAPEVLPVAVPFLSLQPLVENAIRHGMEATRETLRVGIVAKDAGAEAAISVEDDGVGMDPERLRAILAGGGPPRPEAGIGLANVDERMRQVYGDDYGLVIETAPGAGTKVSLRVPKYRPGVLPG